MSTVAPINQVMSNAYKAISLMGAKAIPNLSKVIPGKPGIEIVNHTILSAGGDIREEVVSMLQGPAFAIEISHEAIAAWEATRHTPGMAQ